MPAKTALVLLHEGVEEMEFVAPVDILRRGGVEVTVASASNRIAVTGRNGIQIKADLLLTDALYSPQAVWDLLVIPGGPGVAGLRTNPLVADAVRRHFGRAIGAICAAPLILLDAGVITADGSTAPYTAHPATHAELPAADATQAVICVTVNTTRAAGGTAAGNGAKTNAAGSENGGQHLPTRLITSRGAGTATLFALTLLEEVVGGEAGRALAAEVAESICLQNGQ